MDICNGICTVVSILVLLSSTSFSSPSISKADEFKPINCTRNDHCKNVCFQGKDLESRCDTNGICICDCSDEVIVTSSYPKPCDGFQPDGRYRDYCDKYCNQEYLRPFRYCQNPTLESYCTCVCAYPHPQP